MGKIKFLQYAFLLVLVLLFSTHAIAAPKSITPLNYVAKATYIANYDGDTVRVDIPNFPPLLGANISIRIRGIDTPEIRGKCPEEKIKALKAKKRVRELLVNAKSILLKQLSRGKYFRIVAHIFADGVNIGKILLKEKLAVRYFGGKKMARWCD